MNISTQSPFATKGTNLTIILAIAAGLMLGPWTAAARPSVVLPVVSNPYGKSYGEWAAAWWQWAYSIPAAQNPITDTTGEFSDVGQSGPVFFLAGNYGGRSNPRQPACFGRSAITIY